MTRFEKFCAWVRDVAWPGFTGAYENHETVRHVVTFAAGVFVGWAIS